MDLSSFGHTQQTRGHFEFGSGVLARVVLLAVGFALIFFFQLWGFAAYLAATVVYCRYAANKRGITVGSYPLKRGHGAANGEVLMYCILVVLVLTFFSRNLRDLDVVNSAVLTWMKDPILSGLLNCPSLKYSTPYSCKALHTATGVYVFLTPVLMSCCLHYLVAFSQFRLRVSRSVLFNAFLFTAIIFITLPMVPFGRGGGFGLSMYPFLVILIFCLFQLLLTAFWVRLTAE